MQGSRAAAAVQFNFNGGTFVENKSARLMKKNDPKTGSLLGRDTSLWRERYPDALFCTRCARLLATSRKSDSLGEDQRSAYVCAGCRMDGEAKRKSASLRSIK